jgi:hypothetical protein
MRPMCLAFSEVIRHQHLSRIRRTDPSPGVREQRHGRLPDPGARWAPTGRLPPRGLVPGPVAQWPAHRSDDGVGRHRCRRSGKPLMSSVLALTPDDPTPAYEQLRRQLVDLIEGGQFVEGERLPPLRQVAGDLGLALWAPLPGPITSSKPSAWSGPDVAAGPGWPLGQRPCRRGSGPGAWTSSRSPSRRRPEPSEPARKRPRGRQPLTLV